MRWLPLLLLAACTAAPVPVAADGSYPWAHDESASTLESRIPAPTGFTRVTADDDSFGAWLRGLPTKPGRPDVYLHNGKKKPNQRAQHVVLDIDTGKKDLQQCADAVMRLRAEFLHASEEDERVCFRFTSGDAHPWTKWRDGRRPRVSGNKVRWKDGTPADPSYENFRRYLDSVFNWAGTFSLQRELVKVENPSSVQIGDVFIQGGFPGHAMLVADVAENEDGERMFLLIQSYMPAQDMHVVRNPKDRKNPWYPATKVGKLETPEWTFDYTDLHRFQTQGCPAVN